MDKPELSDDARMLISILESRGAKWITYKDLSHDRRAVGASGSVWDRRYVAALAEECRGRVISTTHGYRLQECTPRNMILESYREISEKGKSTIRRANAVIEYFNRFVDGKVTLPGADGDEPAPPPPKPGQADFGFIAPQWPSL